eukprot:scaffold269570_cov31-Tisochrysis_lutea.AAC.1
MDTCVRPRWRLGGVILTAPRWRHLGWGPDPSSWSALASFVNVAFEGIQSMAAPKHKQLARRCKLLTAYRAPIAPTGAQWQYHASCSQSISRAEGYHLAVRQSSTRAAGQRRQ